MRILLLLVGLIITSCSKKVDLIVHNAVVYSGNEILNKSSAFAVKDGIFIDIRNDDNDILERYSSANIINAQGLPVYSGFIDSHAHFYNLGYSINQVDLFNKSCGVTGLIMTKLDGSAKGGVLVSIAEKYSIPIHAIGIGEGIDDLQDFEPESYSRALLGIL